MTCRFEGAPEFSAAQNALGCGWRLRLSEDSTLRRGAAMAGPRYRPFQFLWSRFSWSGFLIRKERLYDRIYAAVAATMIAFTVIQGE